LLNLFISKYLQFKKTGILLQPETVAVTSSKMITKDKVYYQYTLITLTKEIYFPRGIARLSTL